MPDKHYTTKAIVLSSKPYLEGDALLRLLSPRHGVISAVAKGARKTTSKRAGKLQPLNEVLVQLYAGRTLDTVVQVDTIKMHTSLLDSYIKTLCGLSACQAASLLVQENQPAEKIYRMLSVLLSVMEKVSEQGAVVYLAAFLLFSLAESGFAITYSRCARCSNPLEKAALFSVEEGGALCPACAAAADESAPLIQSALNSAELALERLFNLAGFAGHQQEKPAAQHRLNREEIIMLLAFLQDYFKFHAGAEIKAVSQLLEAVSQ